MSGAARPAAAREIDPLVIGIAASAGGLQGLLVVIAALPLAFCGTILIVQHQGANAASRLPDLLDRRCPIPVRHAVHGERAIPGLVVVCPASRHLTVGGGRRLLLSPDGPVNFVRPSADRLFESLASTCGRSAVAVVLSGSGRDGAAGVRAIKSAGGTVIVEHRTTAQFFGMPGAAIGTGAADMVLPIHDIAGALVALTFQSCNESN
jgi:two-component system chemotaxis response regulator CheB